MHHDVAEEERGHDVVQTMRSRIRVRDRARRRSRIGEQRLDSAIQRDPRTCEIVVDGRSGRDLRAAAGGEERRHPVHDVTNHIAGHPALARRRSLPQLTVDVVHPRREPGGSTAVPVGDHLDEPTVAIVLAVRQLSVTNTWATSRPSDRTTSLARSDKRLIGRAGRVEQAMGHGEDGVERDRVGEPARVVGLRRGKPMPSSATTYTPCHVSVWTIARRACSPPDVPTLITPIGFR